MAFPDGGISAEGEAEVPELDDAISDLGVEPGLGFFEARTPWELGRRLRTYGLLVADDAPLMRTEELAVHVDHARAYLRAPGGVTQLRASQVCERIHPFVRRLVVPQLASFTRRSELRGSPIPEAPLALDFVTVGLEALLRAKVAVLESLGHALSSGDVGGLWNRIEDDIARTVSRGLAGVLLALERAGLQNLNHEARRLVIPMENDQGGLRALFALAVHCEQELRFRRWHQAATSAEGLRGRLPDSYYKATAMHGAAAVDKILNALEAQGAQAAGCERLAEKRCWRLLRAKHLDTELFVAPVPAAEVDRVRGIILQELPGRHVSVVDTSFTGPRRALPGGTSWSSITFVVRYSSTQAVGVRANDVPLDNLTFEDLGMRFKKQGGVPRPSKLWADFLQLLGSCAKGPRPGSAWSRAWPGDKADAGRARLQRIGRALQNVFPGIGGKPFDRTGRGGIQAMFQVVLEG